MKRFLQQCSLLLLTLAIALTLVGLVGHFGLMLPISELEGIITLFGSLGFGAGVVAIIALQSRMLSLLRSLRAQIIAAIGLGGILVAALLQGVARAMFISTDHDLPLLLLVLIFMLVLALGFSIAVGNVLVARLAEVRAGATALAKGDLTLRIPEHGSDEVSLLAADFNQMADELAQSAQRQQELEQSRRDLIAAISHDLRTPLTAVRAMIEALADGVVSEPATQQRYLHSANAQLTNLSTLVDDLFEMAQLDAGVLRLELERASLGDLISDTLSNLQPHAAAHGVQLLGKVDPAADLVLMNAPKLQRVLYNLISNALRHTPSDGTIAIQAQTINQTVHVEVRDTGEGIQPDDLPHIFERTYRGEKSRSRDYGGAGLGLAIVRAIIEAHGGNVWVESQPQHGARFIFTLQTPVNHSS